MCGGSVDLGLSLPAAAGEGAVGEALAKSRYVGMLPHSASLPRQEPLILVDCQSSMEAGASRKLTYMPELDGMRAIAIGAVMLYHFWDYRGSNLVGHWDYSVSNVVGQAVSVVASTGWAGVDVFFAISGFLITGILLDAKDRSGYFRRFFIRRSLRIFPLYYAVTTLILVAGLLIKYLDLPVSSPSLNSLDRLWVNYLYLVDFAVAFGDSNSVPLAIAWSLAIEEQFYLVYPFIVLYTSRRTLMRVLLASLVLAPALRILFFLWTDNYSTAYSLPFCRMDNLAVGGVALLILRHGSELTRERVIRATPWIWAVTVIFLFSWTRKDLPYVMIGYSLVAMATAATIVCLQRSRWLWLLSLLRRPSMIYIGRISYGLYLLHLFVRLAVDQGPLKALIAGAGIDLGATVLRLGLLFIGAIAAATVSWYAFEKPILKLKDRFAPPAAES